MGARGSVLGIGRVAAAALGLAGCAVEDWRNADLQVDVDAATWDDETVVRLCVEGVGMSEEALGAGRVAFPGLPADGALVVTIDTLLEGGDARTGRAGPVTLDGGTTYSVLDWSPCAGEGCETCEASGALAPAGEPDRLLAVRFLDAGRSDAR